jgi:DNA-binding transcriptional ArsR family regulator
VTQSERLDATFTALADPTRRAILARLMRGEASVMELAEPFEMSQPAISRHLKMLERAGLISRGRDAQRRPCRIEPEALQAVTGWLEQYRKLWEAIFSALIRFWRTCSPLVAVPHETIDTIPTRERETTWAQSLK